MPRSPESYKVTSQRKIINDEVSRLFTNGKSPRDRDSFYRQKPAEDDDNAVIYDQAKGDPTLYAILDATHHQELLLDAALQMPERFADRERRVELARDRLVDLDLLEQHYRDPLEHPIGPMESDL